MNTPRKSVFGRVATLCVCAISIVAIGAATAGAGDVEPAGGSDFESGDNGWTVTTAKCSLLGGGGTLCTASGERVAAGGNPGGALRARSSVIVNALGLFKAEHVFRSPTFVSGPDPLDAAFSYDRRFAAGAIALGANADVDVVLVDESNATETVLMTDPLGREDAVFATRVAGVPSGVIRPNASYHLEIRVSTSSRGTPEEVISTTDAFFDNIRLVNAVRGGGSGSGQGGIAPGGSVTLLRKCTIFGTPGDDIIVGTKGTDIICALAGDDKVKSLRGRDVIDAADGNDRARGGKKADLILGLSGKDKLFGSKGADALVGGKDTDVLKAGAHNDNISARDGERDLVDGGSGKRNRARTDSKDQVKRVQRLLPR